MEQRLSSCVTPDSCGVSKQEELCGVIVSILNQFELKGGEVRSHLFFSSQIANQG